tara:strand:- start:313 stop:546 length:234 start_codon:yes stop_codon:yes gene_type:complete
MDFKLEYTFQEVDKEYKHLLNDVMKFITILVVLNLLMFMSNPSENSFLGGTYTKLMVYIVLGVCTYWLVISKVVIFD